MFFERALISEKLIDRFLCRLIIIEIRCQCILWCGNAAQYKFRSLLGVCASMLRVCFVAAGHSCVSAWVVAATACGAMWKQHKENYKWNKINRNTKQHIKIIKIKNENKTGSIYVAAGPLELCPSLSVYLLWFVRIIYYYYHCFEF